MKYRDRTFEKENKHKKYYKNIFVEEVRNTNVDTEDYLPLSTLKLSKKKTAHIIKIKKRKQLTNTLKK